MYEAIATTAVRVAPSQAFSLRRAGSTSSLASASSSSSQSTSRVEAIKPVENASAPLEREVCLLWLLGNEPLSRFFFFFFWTHKANALAPFAAPLLSRLPLASCSFPAP